MNYATSIAYNTRKGDMEPTNISKMFTIKEQYIKIIAVASAICCSAMVFFLMSL